MTVCVHGSRVPIPSLLRTDSYRAPRLSLSAQHHRSTVDDALRLTRINRIAGSSPTRRMLRRPLLDAHGKRRCTITLTLEDEQCPPAPRPSYTARRYHAYTRRLHALLLAPHSPSPTFLKSALEGKSREMKTESVGVPAFQLRHRRVGRWLGGFKPNSTVTPGCGVEYQYPLSDPGKMKSKGEKSTVDDPGNERGPIASSVDGSANNKRSTHCRIWNREKPLPVARTKPHKQGRFSTLRCDLEFHTCILLVFVRFLRFQVNSHPSELLALSDWKSEIRVEERGGTGCVRFEI
ncbi:hypothetical protein B0H11DRAFT_2429811 [Mycena galericulata]|nr:hypothetical protein B0H11DRAFT_2429811 [Mycena galericulata]